MFGWFRQWSSFDGVAHEADLVNHGELNHDLLPGCDHEYAHVHEGTHEGLVDGVPVQVQRFDRLLDPSQVDLLVHEAFDRRAYTTGSACESARLEEAERFERLTGLAAFLAYCYDSEDSYDRYPWALRIDAFGAAAVQPQISGALLFGEPVGSTRGVLALRLMDALAAQGREAVSVTVRNTGGFGELSAIYYSDVKLDLTVIEHARVTSIGQCQATLGAVARAFSAAGSEPLVLDCVEQPMGDYEVQSIGLATAHVGRDAEESYASFAACEAQLPGVMALYRAAPNSHVVDGQCNLDVFDRVWGISLVETRPTPE